MPKTKSHRDAERRTAKKKFDIRPAVDTLTVAWITMLSTTLMCEIGSGSARMYVAYVDPRAGMMRMFSAYLMLAAAFIGILLLLTTPIVVKRKRSNPPMPLVVFAFAVGALPWIVMLSQLME